VTTTAEPSTDGAKDFDFWIGRWKIVNRRLVKPLAGSTEWETFEAIAHAHPLPGGIGNYDDFVGLGWRPGFVGMALRLYNRATRKWSIYWLDNRNTGIDANGELTAPVVGEFRNGIGVFTGRDTFEGRPIIVKYTWSHITEQSARWEQAFSSDEGRTWETNWMSEMSRLHIAEIQASIETMRA
jgi:hypothetical protein